MKRTIGILIAAFLLSGCAAGERFATVIAAAQSFTVTQGQVDIAKNSYDGLVLAPLAKYASLPRCKTGQKLTLNNPCHDRKLLKQIREIDKSVAVAFDKTQASISSGDNSGASVAYNTLITAIDLAKSLINQTGVSVLGI